MKVFLDFRIGKNNPDEQIRVEKMSRDYKIAQPESVYLDILNAMSNFAGIVDREYRLTFANRAVMESCGYSADDVVGKVFWETPWFNRSKKSQEIVRDAVKKVLSGEVERVQTEVSAFKKDGTEFPTIFNASSLRKNGEIIAVVVEGKPITEQKMLERKLKDTIEKLKAAQEELMTPVVQIWDKILALPVIGVVDSYRAQKITETLLDRIVKTKSEFVIIDISGVASVDTEVANHIIKTVKAASLLGCTCIITGIRPEIAQTMTHIGIKLDIITRRDLYNGLMFCLESMGYVIKERQDQV